MLLWFIEQMEWPLVIEMKMASKAWVAWSLESEPCKGKFI